MRTVIERRLIAGGCDGPADEAFPLNECCMTTIDRQCVCRLAERPCRRLRQSRPRPRVRAWELLQERDAEGECPRALALCGAAALAEFARPHREDPDDFGVVHHLAIAFHARAWDLELAGDPLAAETWEEARLLADPCFFR